MLGTWSTLHSCNIALQDSGYDYEICLSINGEAENRKKQHCLSMSACRDTQSVLHFLKKSGKAGRSVVRQGAVSPPTARQLIADKATGKYIFFLDNHCLVTPKYFELAMQEFDRSPVDLLHSSTFFYDGENASYHYMLTLEENFWATSSKDPFHPTKAHPIAAGGHGGFAVRRSVWEDIGGYWNGFTGYGGEELSIDLQMWMRGYEVWMHPKMIHYHWAGRRPYARHFTAEYYRNMMMSANIIGGEKWLNRVYQTFSTKYPELVRHPVFDLYQEAYYQSEPHARELSKLYIRSLDEQLEWFKRKGIPQ